jgi:hypothetical protein
MTILSKVPLKNPRYIALDSTDNLRYGIKAIQEIKDTAPKTKEKIEPGLS